MHLNGLIPITDEDDGLDFAPVKKSAKDKKRRYVMKLLVGVCI